jgi:hypothetical protein
MFHPLNVRWEAFSRGRSWPLVIDLEKRASIDIFQCICERIKAEILSGKSNQYFSRRL